MSNLHQPALVIATYLRAKQIECQVEGEQPWPIYVGAFIDKPDRAMTVYDAIGRMDGRRSNGFMREHPGIQVRTRSLEQTESYQKAARVSDMLDEIKREIVEVIDEITKASFMYVIHSVTRTTGIIPMGEEPGSRRNNFTVNAVVSIELQIELQ